MSRREVNQHLSAIFNKHPRSKPIVRVRPRGFQLIPLCSPKRSSLTIRRKDTNLSEKQANTLQKSREQTKPKKSKSPTFNSDIGIQMRGPREIMQKLTRTNKSGTRRWPRLVKIWPKVISPWGSRTSSIRRQPRRQNSKSPTFFLLTTVRLKELSFWTN